MAVTIDELRRLIASDHGLSVVSIVRPDGTVSSSVVNAGLLAHPAGGSTVLGFVVRASSYKCARLRIDPRVTVTVRAGWEWQAVEGTAELVGPLDPAGDVDIAALLRDVFRVAGGSHDNWDEYDRVMATEQRTAVLVTPMRVYGNAGA
jgi:PPOX class probable F420-dependent enzyme